LWWERDVSWLRLDEEKLEALLRSDDGREERRADPLEEAYAPLELTVGKTKERAKRRLAEIWQRIRPNAAVSAQGYVPQITDNLIEGVTLELFTAEMAAGRGRELAGKLRAVHSSSAMAVNTFAPWKRDLDQLSLAGITGFTRLRFEEPCDLFDDG